MQHRKQSAFTLVELLVAMAILGILAGIAIPAYHGYKVRAQMSEADRNIEALKQAEEKYYLENNEYFYKDGTNAELATASGGRWQAKGTDGPVLFDYKVTADGTSYKITATGKAGTIVAGKTAEYP